MIPVLTELRFEVIEQRFVRELHGASERVAEKLSAELANEGVPALREQIVSQPVDAFDFDTALECGPIVNGPAAQVFLTPAADGVETFERIAIGVDADVTASAAAIRRVLFRQLAHR